MANNVIIPILFEPDDSKIIASIEELQKKGTVSDGAAAVYKAGNTELQKRIQLDTQVDAAQKKQLATITQIQQKTSQMASTVIKSTNDVLTGIQKQKNTVDLLQKALDKLNQRGASANAITNVTNALEKQKAVLSQLEAEEQKAEVSGESLRKQKRALTEEIARLIDAGQQESEMYQNLVKRAGDIDDAIKDASGAIARAGSDTRGLQNTLQLAGGVAAGFSIAQGSAALFGEESEDVQKTLLKVNAAMAILNGLQQIQAVLTDESIKSLLNDTRLRVVKNAQMVIENGLQSSSVVVRGAATAAQWALNAAMAANPIGIVAVALAAVIGAMVLYTNNAKRMAQAQSTLNSVIHEATDGLQAELDGYTRFNTRRMAELDASNARTSEKLNQELAGLRLSAKATADQLDAVNNAFNMLSHVKGIDLKPLIEQQGTLRKRLDDINTEGQAKTTALTKAAFDEQQQDAQATADNLVKLAKNGSAQELAARRSASAEKRKLALDELAFDAKTKGTSIENDKGLAQRRKNIEADYIDEVQQLNMEAEDKSKAARLRRLSAEKSLLDALLIAVKEGSAEQLKAQQDLIDKQVQVDLASIDRRNAARSTINAEELAIITKAENEKRKLRIAYADKEIKEQSDIELVMAQSRVAAFREGTKDYYAAQRVFLAQQADNNALDVQQSTDSQETKAAKIKLIYTSLNKDLDSLRRQQFEQEIAQRNAEIDALNNLTLTRLNIKASDPKNNDPFAAQQAVRTQELANIEEERARIHEKALTDQLYAEQQYQADLTNNTAKGEQKRAEIIQASAEREKQIRESLKAATYQIATEIAGALFDVDKAERDQELQGRLDDLNKEKEAALRAKNITEDQKANIQRIYDNRERQLKNEAARKERKASVDQALVNGALAVTNALATVHPFYAALIAAGLAAASTAVQISKINSTPIPQYAKGTRSAKKGYAWVGEEGPELVKLNGGEEIWTKSQSEKVNRAWSSSSTHLDPDDVLSGRNIPSNQTAVIAEFTGAAPTVAIDYKALGKAVAESMPEHPTMQMNADENGFSMYLIMKNKRTQILNQRYSTK